MIVVVERVPLFTTIFVGVLVMLTRNKVQNREAYFTWYHTIASCYGTQWYD